MNGHFTSNEKILLEEKEVRSREVWGNKAEFILSCIGLSVGIGNVWRFPYLAYQNGGGAFLVAYAILLILVGKPIFFAELALGQFTGRGATQVWRCLPIAKGTGVAMVIVSSTIAVYYNVVMSYALYYAAQSLRWEVPWAECKDWWGANSNCYVRTANQTSCWSEDADKATCNNGTQIASEQFWERYVLRLSDSIDNLGVIKWDLAVTLAVCWLLVFLGLAKGIKSSGKVVYFTATFPYVILISLAVYGCSLPGAIEGLRYLFLPTWSKLLDISVWRAAAEQLLYSLSLGCGCLIMYASYNKFDNKLYKDAVFVSSLDFTTSLLAGTLIFSVLGNMATEMNLPIATVAKGGQGLAFVTYPEALSRLPVPQLWSVLFFFMLFLLAIDSEFSYMETVITAFLDEWPTLMRFRATVTGIICIVLFLIGLPCVTEGGQYVFNLMDTFGGGQAGIFIVTIEIIALMWGYGADRFADDVEFMLGKRPSLYWRFCWKFISPIVLICVVMGSLWKHSALQYGGRPYPQWAEYIGWALVSFSLLQLPIWAAVQLYIHRKDWRAVLRPDPNWGPSDQDAQNRYRSPLSGIENLTVDTASL